MSEKFLQVMIPCKDCLVRAACQDKRKTSLREDKIHNFMLVMEIWDTHEKCYKKGLMECWANMGWEIFSHLKSDDFTGMKESAPEFLDLLVELTGLIQWIIHSTSWEKGEKFEFDKFEIRSKLEKAKGWI